MKNFKRTLALVLAVIMVAGMFASVSAAKNTAWYSEGVRYIEGIGVATIGNTADEKITRDEFVLWIAKIESGNVKDSYWTGAATTSFTDVTEDHNQVAIKYSQMRGFIEGNGDGTFAPEKNITLGEAAAVIVRLMRYQSKVEGDATNWAWANMEVANEYCKAFNYTFRNNVGGGIYDYDYELTKGEAAYLLATVMNGVEGQVDNTHPYKTIYKSLTIDGHNLGEMFIGHTNVAAYGDVYTVTEIKFDENGYVDSKVVLTPLASDKKAITLKADEFTALVRVSLGLAAEAEEDEEEICVQDTVKIGNLVDVTLDKDGEIIALEVNSGSKVVDTHIVQYAMLETDPAARLNWTTNNLVTGSTTSSVDREATMNGTWSSDLLFTWKDIEKETVYYYYEADGETPAHYEAEEVVVAATLVFAGEEYDFEVALYTEVVDHDNDATTEDKEVITRTSWTEWNSVTKEYESLSDLVVVRNVDNKLRDYTPSNLQYIIDKIPTVAEGEVTLIFNDTDNDGDYDTVVIAEAAQKFIIRQNDGKWTYSYNYYYDGYRIDKKTPSNKLELIVLAKGRHFAYPALDSDAKHDVNVHKNSTELKVLYEAGDTTVKLDGSTYKCNVKNCSVVNTEKHYNDVGSAMNPYATIELGTFQSGVIEESVLTTVGATNFFRVKVKLAGGAYQTVYIPVVNEVAANTADYTYASNTAPKTVGEKVYTLGTVTKTKVADNSTSETTGFEAYYDLANNKLVFDYTLNGATASVDFAWNYNEKLAFAYDAMALTGIDVESGAKDYAKKAAKLVGQYISFMVDEDNVATYCVSGVAGTGETGYLLDVAESDVENMYNVTIATVDKNGKVEDVEIYSVNATASTMFAGTDNYSKITAIFNKGTIESSNSINNVDSWNEDVALKNGKDTITNATYLNVANIASLQKVAVKSNGTFSYIELVNTTAINATNAGVWADYLNAQNPDITAAASTNNIGKVVVKDNAGATVAPAKTDKNDKNYYAPSANNHAETQYEGKYYSCPVFVYDEDNKSWTLAVYEQTITLTYSFKEDADKVTASNVLNLNDTDLKNALVKSVSTDGKKVTAWNTYVGLEINDKFEVVAVKPYTEGGYDERGSEAIGNDKVWKVAGKLSFVDGVATITYDFRGIDEAYTVTSAKITTAIREKDASADTTGTWYTYFGATASNVAAALNAAAAEQTATYTVTNGALDTIEYADVYAGTSAYEIKYNVAVKVAEVNNKSSISNVTFTAMASTETGYIPGSYWFTIDAADEVYFSTASDNAKLADVTNLDADKYTTETRKYRVTSTTEVVLLTPTAAGWNVEVMTPAEAAKLDLIVAGYSFVDAYDSVTKKDQYTPYDFKLDAIVLVGQEALVETEKEVVDDGKDVSKDEYLVYVPSDAETSLYAPEGSKTIKVISNKSVYAVPSGTEIGSIYYEYNAYTGAEMPTIKSVIKSGWYLVEADGEIIEEFTWATGKKKDITVSVDAGKIVAEDADENAVDVSKAVLFYYDINGTLKKVSDAKVTFASGSIFTTAMKSATDALNTAKANLAVYGDSTKYSAATVAKYEAAYDAAVAAYNEALATNIDKYFNGNIWDSFKTVAANESAIQGAAEYKVTFYTVDDTTFIIVNTWSADADGIVTVGSALK